MNARHRAALGLGWVLWRRQRRGLCAAALLMAAAALIAQAGPWGPPMMTALVLPLGLGLVYLVTVCAFEGTDLAARESGFPPYLWVLPVGTIQLVGWPMLFGVLLTAAGWVLLARLVMRPLGLEAALLWPAALFGAVAASVQAMLWVPWPLPFLRVVALCCWVMIAVSLGVGGRIAFGITDETLAVIYGIVIVVSFFVTVRGVGRARCGEAMRWTWAPRSALEGGSAPRRRPLASPESAQFWMEWRRNGLLAVLLCAQLWVLLAATMLWAWRFAPGELDRLTPWKVMWQLALLTLLPPAFGAVVGAGARSTLSGKSGMSISSFMGVRPVRGRMFVTARLKAGAAATAAAWGAALVLTALLMPVPIRVAGGERMLGSIIMEYATPRSTLLTGLAILAAMVITWKVQVDSLVVALTGRAWIVSINSIALGAMLTGAMVLGATLYAHPEWREGAERMGVRLGASLVLLKLALAAWTGRALVQRRLMTLRAALRWLTGWGAAVTAASAVVWTVTPDAWRQNTAGITMVVMLMTPLVRPGAALLAVEWNRHR